MTEDELIELAYQAGLPFWNNTGVPIHMNELRKFAELVLAHHKAKPKKNKDICDND